MKETKITPALIINNVEDMGCVKKFIPDQEVPTLEQDQKSMFFKFFFIHRYLCITGTSIPSINAILCFYGKY